MATLLSADDEKQQDILQSRITAASIAPDAATLIVVLGMHRGGTSVTIRAMNAMGVDLGNNLGAPVAGENDKGFFEDLDIVEINEAILAAAGAKWHTLAPIDLGRIDASKLKPLRARAMAALRDKCRDRTFAVKDPRLPRLLPFWQPVFDQVGLRVAYVIAVRNPISVSRSLYKRDGFGMERSYWLWLNHMVPALHATHDKLRVVVEYDRLLDSPRDELIRIADQLGLVLNDEGVRTFEREFLDRNLQHWRFDARHLEDMHSAPRAVRELFGVLLSMSRSGGEQRSPALETAVTNAQHYLEEIALMRREELAGNKMASILEYVAAPFRAMRRRISS